jgi:hypothetical protein
MRIHSLYRVTALASLAACLWAPLRARAADTEPPVEEVARSAAATDTSRLLPRWLHVHAAVGVGWLASPEWMRKFYQAGQGYELGFDTQPGATLRLRLNGEYQVLPAVTDVEFSYVTTIPGLDSEPARDTVLVQSRSTGWIGSLRLEGQWGLTRHLWLIGGFGRGYLSTGLNSVHEHDAMSSIDFEFPGSSGWAWIGTAGTSYEFEVFGPRLSAEVRTSYLMRDQSRFQAWSIRLGWGGY